jgi:hypothetical protein
VDGGEWDKFVFSYFAWLVQRGTVVTGYLGKSMVGHGHNDLDQKFGVISRYLRGKGTSAPGHNMYSPQHFIHMLRELIFANYQTKVYVVAWHAVLGFKAFLKPCINPDFHGHSSTSAGEGATLLNKAGGICQRDLGCASLLA